jgi:transposase
MEKIDLIEFSKIIANRSRALEFLCKRYKTTKTIHCPSCSSRKYYTMVRGNLRCKKCRTDYRPFPQTMFNAINIDFVRWFVLIKLFDLGISARLDARESDVSYPTALYAFDCIRYSILYELAKTDKILKGEIEADEAYFGGKRKGNRGRGAKNKTIVFGILERKGKVSVDKAMYLPRHC